jgi:hypothetical protein
MKFRFSSIFAAASLVVACSSTTASNGMSPAGSGAQKLSIGSPCGQDSDCGSSPFMCMQGDHPGGYCMANCKIANGDGDCPSEAICQFDGTTGECHKKCSMPSDCRTGYDCAPASSSSTSTASHSFCDVAGGMGMGDGGTKMDSGTGMNMDSGMKMDSGMNMDGAMKMDGM